MMFFLDSAFALDLIALTLGAGLVYFSVQNKGPGAFFAKVIGSLVFILALLTLIFTSYFGTTYWFTNGVKGAKHQMEMQQQKIMMDLQHREEKKSDEERHEEGHSGH